MYYYLIVVLIAIIFFVLMVVFLNYNINKSLTSTVYPPVENSCPDFWLQNKSNHCVVPNITIPDGNYGTFFGDTLATKVNQSPVTHGFATTDGVHTIDFKNPNWGTLGANSLCNKKNWASTYGITWDGITNYNGVC